MLEVSKGAPREFIDRKIKMSDCKYRVVWEILKLAKRMINRGGKAMKSIVEGWRVTPKWISELRRSLVKGGIREEEFEEEKKRERWNEGIDEKSSLK